MSTSCINQTMAMSRSGFAIWILTKFGKFDGRLTLSEREGGELVLST